jgi:hypothetical protein
MTELEKPVRRKSRLICHAAGDRRVVVELESIDTISIRPIGTRRSNAYSMTFEDFFWTCARNRSDATRREKSKTKKMKRRGRK